MAVLFSKPFSMLSLKVYNLWLTLNHACIYCIKNWPLNWHLVRQGMLGLVMLRVKITISWFSCFRSTSLIWAVMWISVCLFHCLSVAPSLWYLWKYVTWNTHYDLTDPDGWFIVTYFSRFMIVGSWEVVVSNRCIAYV